jgi:hypothetical protein
MVMLAKQGWGLVQNPDSLVARIFREKYYSGDSFLNSRLGTRPSYVWRNISNAKKLLQEGLLWRVRDGKSINIWGDWWVPSPTSYVIQSPIKILDKEAKVCALVDTSTMWWNISLVKSLFSEEEATMILSMPICPQRQ